MNYLGSFFCLTNKEQKDEARRRHGEFNMIVDAEDADAAIDMFRERLFDLRTTSDLFDGETSIYFVQLLELAGFPRDRALMVNYRSFIGDPLLPFIGCSVPNDVSDNCRIYNWDNSRPEIDGRKANLFLEFKGDRR